MSHEEYYDHETCSECGGRCCRNIYDGSCNEQIGDWQETFDYHKVEEHAQAKYNPLEEHRLECQYLGDIGCIIPFEFRPNACKEYKCKKLTNAINLRKINENRIDV